MYWTLDFSDRIVGTTSHRRSSRLRRGRHAPAGILDQRFDVLTVHAVPVCFTATPQQAPRSTNSHHRRSDRLSSSTPGRALTVRGVEGGFYADFFWPCRGRCPSDGIDCGQLGPKVWLSG